MGERMAAHPGFTLSQLIKNAADEIRAARSEEPKEAVIQFESCELELAVTVGGETGGGVKFLVMEASAKAKAETVSRIRLKFAAIPDNPVVALAGKRGVKRPGAKHE